MKDLAGQTAIVTGAGSGIGEACARILAREGATVAVVDISSDRAQQCSSAIRADGGTARPFGVDVTSSRGFGGFVESVLAWTGRIDVLICNVGIYPTALLDHIDDEVWDHVMRTNATSTFYAVRAVAPVMRSQRYGRIVFTSSVTGPLTAMPGLAHYAASKGALGGFMRGSAVELAAYDITVNSVLPGTVHTDGVNGSGGSSFLDEMVPSIPMRRAATPADIGYAIRALVAPEAGYLTGVELVVDGGQRLVEGGRLSPLSHTYRPLTVDQPVPSPTRT
ncbi:SDR family NAD(P)-dependent oxidoreductase [Mycolicibacterium sp.]